MAVVSIAMDWNTRSDYYINLASHIAANPTRVPFAYRLGTYNDAEGSGSARADIELRVTENSTNIVVGSRVILNQYFPQSGTNDEAHLLALTSTLKPGTAYTMMVHATNGHASSDTTGTMTAGPIIRQFVTAGTAPIPNPNPNPTPTPTPDPDPTPTPTPTPSPSRAGIAAILIGGLAVAALIGKKGRRL